MRCLPLRACSPVRSTGAAAGPPGRPTQPHATWCDANRLCKGRQGRRCCHPACLLERWARGEAIAMLPCPGVPARRSEVDGHTIRGLCADHACRWPLRCRCRRCSQRARRIEQDACIPLLDVASSWLNVCVSCHRPPYSVATAPCCVVAVAAAVPTCPRTRHRRHAPSAATASV